MQYVDSQPSPEDDFEQPKRKGILWYVQKYTSALYEVFAGTQEEQAMQKRINELMTSEFKKRFAETCSSMQTHYRDQAKNEMEIVRANSTLATMSSFDAAWRSMIPMDIQESGYTRCVRVMKAKLMEAAGVPTMG